MRLAIQIAVAVLVAATSAASAQDVGDSTADVEARALFEAGRVAYAAGRFDDALAHFQRAYELSRRSELLYNVGQAADRLRRDEIALSAYEQFLRERPESPAASVARRRVAFLRERIAEDNMDAGAPPHAAASEPARRTSPRERTDRTAEATPLTGRWWFWAGIGALVVAVVAVTVVATSGTDTQRPLSGDVGPGGVVVAVMGW